MFLKRNSKTVIVYNSHHVVGQKIKETIADGNTIMLKTKDKSVLVRNIVKIDNERYRGIIAGFEPSDTLEHLGLVIGQEVEFDEQEVFVCLSG